MKKLFILLLICFALIADDIVSKEEWVREHTPARELEDLFLGNGYFGVVVDEITGEYTIGQNMLGSGSLTDHSGYEDFTYSWPTASGTDWIAISVDGMISKNSRDTHTCTCYLDDETLHVEVEDWLGMSVHEKHSCESWSTDDMTMEFLRYEITINNTDASEHEIGYMHYLDTKFGSNDGVRLTPTDTFLTTSFIYYSPDIPPAWKDYTYNIGGVHSDLVNFPPDVLWFGSWPHSTNNTFDLAEWEDDLVEGLGSDTALMYQWYPRTVAPGDSMNCDICLYICDISSGTFSSRCFTREPEFTEEYISIELLHHICNTSYSALHNVEITLDIDIESYELSSESSDMVHSFDQLAQYGGSSFFYYNILLQADTEISSIPYTITCTTDEWESPRVTSGTIVLREDDVSEHVNTPQEICISAYPNPFNSSCYIELPDCSTAEIFDIEGKLVDSIERSCNWSPATLESGVYTIRLTNSTEYKRIIYMK